jgi:cell division protein FtsZ
MIELAEDRISGANLKVVGVGGGGCNAVNTMIKAGLNGVEFVGANTDAQALASCSAPVKVQLGAKLTKGLGAGANPEIGRNAMLEDKDRIREMLVGADMVFITAGLGGGTGTGGAPILATIARDAGALTVAVVTKPFLFEGKRRQRQAEEGLKELRKCVDTLITIPNQRLLNIAGRDMSLLETFRTADEVLLQAVRGISDLITINGLINLDFADVRTVMSEMGLALMGTGIAKGENRAVEAAQRAISSPLLEDITISGARGILINITGGADLTLYEVNEASTLVQEEADEDANIIFGAVIDESLHEEMRVTVIATGFGRAEEKEERIPESRSAAAEHEKTVIHFTRKESNRDVPTFIRQEKGVEIQERPAKTARGRLSPNLREDEYDIPTFLRKQAD